MSNRRYTYDNKLVVAGWGQNEEELFLIVTDIPTKEKVYNQLHKNDNVEEVDEDKLIESYTLYNSFSTGAFRAPDDMEVTKLLAILDALKIKYPACLLEHLAEDVACNNGDSVEYDYGIVT